MDALTKQILVRFLLFPICYWCCRQMGYSRELTHNRPSGSLKAGYCLAVVTMTLSLTVAAFCKNPGVWQIFLGILPMTLVFCVNITFSLPVSALTLAVCAFQLHTHNSFPLFEV